ncbi:hypothetical protein BC940DRAFT_107880 [Gongronella butleri]|nr:hypothetical protein BC940DRAFT_107880 [Gongronella butleri]
MTTPLSPASNEPVPVSSKQALAMKHYAAGIQHEQEGSLTHAMLCFQTAFKIDPDIDVIYRGRRASSSSSVDWEDDEEQGQLTTLPNPANLELQFSQEQLSYTPRKKNKPVLINKLPGEILVAVLCEVSLQSLGTIAQFARACKAFYLFTRSPTLWRHASEYLFKQPNALPTPQFDQVALYQSQWLDMMKHRPRIRYDGVYIAVCQYVRPGEAETAWARPVHLVTHYRYVRFFPDGTMLHVLSNDEPAKVVRQLAPGISSKRKWQLFRGNFQWDGATKVSVTMQEIARPIEQFRMEFDIQHPYPNTKNRRKPYKMLLSAYTSKRTDREELNVYSLSHVKPFVFSPVTSYVVSF